MVTLSFYKYSFEINEKVIKNTLLVTNAEGLNKINTRIFKIINYFGLELIFVVVIFGR